MKHNLMSCSFVGVWEKTLPNIPEFDRKFSLDLFGDPYSTTCGMTPEGFVIAKQFSPSPHPNVIINPNRIQITDLSIEKVADIYAKIFEIMRINFQQDMMFPFSSIGINSEHEWIDLPLPSADFLSNRFFGSILYAHSDTIKIHPYDIRFEWQFKDSTRFNVLLQPRAGIQNGIFAGINDDRFWSEKPILSKDLVFDLFAESVAKVKKRVEELVNS